MLEQFYLRYNLHSAVVLTCHNSLRQKIHRLLNEELLLDRDFLR